MTHERAAYEVANSYLGLKEWPGAKHNPKVIGMFAKAGHPEIQDDETPWCAAFVGAVLAEAGTVGTGALNARSYLKWGRAVDLNDAEQGDVVVFWRGTRDGWQGHVAFYHSHDAKNVYVIGGNQGNAVTLSPYSRDRLLGVRRASVKKANLAQSTTLQAAGATAVSGAVGAATAIGSLNDTAQVIVIVAAVVAGLGLLWIMRERVKKFAAGVR